MRHKYKIAILGGTFDRLHSGHKKLLDTGFKSSEKVAVGIATSELYKGKWGSHAIEDYQARKKSVEAYLRSQNFLSRAEIIPISDIYGNSLKREDIDVIFATEGNLENVEKINAGRERIGFKPLKVEIVPYVLGDDSEIVTSSRIRFGEIDREGNSYLKQFTNQKKYILPEELRVRLKKPIGKVVRSIKNIEKSLDRRNMVIAVGDIAAINLFEHELQADISVIDHKTKRHDIDPEKKKILSKLQKSSEVLVVDNQAGAIERRAVGVINKALKMFQQTSKKQVVIINGEEDLMTIPAILLSPLESMVLYGQPDKGVAVVKVTEKKKKEIKDLFAKFS